MVIIYCLSGLDCVTLEEVAGKEEQCSRTVNGNALLIAALCT